MNKPRNTDNIILTIKYGKYLGELIIEGRKRFRLTALQFMFMSCMSRYELKKLETGKVEFLLNRELRSICNMLDIDYKLALELTDCSLKLIEELTN